MYTRRQFIKKIMAAAAVLATPSFLICTKKPVDIAQMMEGGVITIYSGAAPKRLTDRHNGKLLCTITMGNENDRI